jgi:hypothetical protein
MADFGGIVRFTYNGTPLRIRARVTIEPTGGKYDAEHNQDGSFDRYYQPMGPAFDFEFVDSVDGVTAISQPWDAIMSGGPYNCSLIEDSNGVLHTFTGAKFIGRAKIDRLKGLVSGVTGQCPVGGYQKTTAG